MTNALQLLNVSNSMKHYAIDSTISILDMTIIVWIEDNIIASESVNADVTSINPFQKFQLVVNICSILLAFVFAMVINDTYLVLTKEKCYARTMGMLRMKRRDQGMIPLSHKSS